jgi:hypothetical protein
MLVNTPQIQIIPREFRTPDGRVGTAFFAVFERDGRVFAKLVSVSYKTESSESKPLALCASCKKSSIVAPLKIGVQKIVSPYFNTFSIITSQPTRAPAFN